MKTAAFAETINRYASRFFVMMVCSAACLPAQTPLIRANGFVNAAASRKTSDTPVAARGSLVRIYGSDLAKTSARAMEFPLPTQMGNTHVFFGNTAAPLLYVSSGEIVAQVPFELAESRTIAVTVQNGTAKSAALNVALVDQDPEIFVAVKASGDLVSPSNPVKPGESITIYATGLGELSAPVASGAAGPAYPMAASTLMPVVNVGGEQMTVHFAGLAPGQVIYQINATAPAHMTAPSGNISIEHSTSLSLLSQL